MSKQEFFTYQLPNGIRCILKRVASPVAWCAMTINAGSRDEAAGEWGAAHFAEHLLFKGTHRRKAYQINSRLEKLGGELNAFTTKEETVVHATVLKSDLAKAVELIADVVFRSTLPEREVAREREVILDEINACRDMPFERIWDEFEELLFAGSPLAHNILGTRPSVSKFTDADIGAFTHRCYNTDQMVFSVAANISEAAFVRLSEKYLGDIEASRRGFERPRPAEVPSFLQEFKRHNHQAHCIIGSRARGNDHPGRIALVLLVNYLGGPAANSLLNVLLRERNGLTYSVEASYTPYGDTGIAAVYFGTDKDNVERCLDLIRGAQNGLCGGALTRSQLAAAKKQLIGQLAISMEGREGYMLNAAKSYMVYGEVDTSRELYNKINSVTVDDIVEAARGVFPDTSVLIYR